MIKKVTSFMIITVALVFQGRAQDSTLDNYIRQALESNVALQQKQYSYEKSLAALKEAKRMYFPVFAIESRYSRAEGGRTATIPFGELMNPAYDNLDAINQSLRTINPAYPEFPDYPEVDDYTINFIREKEQETKIQMQLPVFNTAIIHNHKIQDQLTEVEKINVDIYKRELIKEVKLAYVNYLRALQQLTLYKNTSGVVTENLKNRESLYEHEKITLDEVYAAKAKVKEIEKELSQARKDSVMAKAYFNFLLNKDFKADVVVESIQTKELFLTEVDSLQEKAIRQREEISRLNKHMAINGQQVQLEKSEALPQLSMFAAYGYQGKEYSFTHDSHFAQAGVKLTWNLFTSGQRQARVQQAKIETAITREKMYEAERQIQLEVIDTYYALQTARKGIELAKDEVENYRKSHDLVRKKYERGMLNHLEYSDALNNLLNAENRLILARYEYYSKQVKLERKVASVDINL